MSFLSPLKALFSVKGLQGDCGGDIKPGVTLAQGSPSSLFTLQQTDNSSAGSVTRKLWEGVSWGLLI